MSHPMKENPNIVENNWFVVQLSLQREPSQDLDFLYTFSTNKEDEHVLPRQATSKISSSRKQEVHAENRLYFWSIM